MESFNCNLQCNFVVNQSETLSTHTQVAVIFLMWSVENGVEISYGPEISTVVGGLNGHCWGGVHCIASRGRRNNHT